MCDTPIGTTRWFTGQDWNGLKKLMYSGGGGGEGVLSHLSNATTPDQSDLEAIVMKGYSAFLKGGCKMTSCVQVCELIGECK